MIHLMRDEVRDSCETDNDNDFEETIRPNALGYY
jgi:hypothetical protein